MMKFSIVFASAVLASSVALAAEYHIKVLDSPAPADELSPELAKTLSPTGFAVMRSETSTLCEIWFRKEVPAKADFEASNELLYPFLPGEFVGVIRYRRRGADFRDRDIDRGMYTMRYQLQPVDGNHVGTSITRDFLLLVNAANDKTLKPLERDKLVELSAEAAQATHPAILSLQKVRDDKKPPTVFEHGDEEWKVVQFLFQASADGRKTETPISFVVEGFARE